MSQDWWFLDSRMAVKADSGMTGGAYTLLEFTAERGFGPPRHVHRAEDEAFVVMSGSLRGTLGDEEWEAGEGSFVFLPRGIPHAFVVTSAKPLVALQLTNPAGFEKFVAELGRPAEGPGLPPPSEPDIPRLAEVAARHGYDIVGPPLGL
ncbi:MAG TPA: cupin domain-containing protein [Kribbella sp.]|nr:cupin domain-containing protein [Kribbella sp.]